MNLLDLRPTPIPSRRDVDVRVGAGRVIRAAPQERRVVVVAIAPTGAPWLADATPGAVVADMRYRDPRCSVEHLRFHSAEGLTALPGLVDGSLVRDAVRCALLAGAPSVDVLLARGDGLGPQDLDDGEVQDALSHPLADSPGAMLLFPDLRVREPAGPGDGVDVSRELDRVLGVLDRVSQGWTERFQTGLLDCSFEDPGLRRLLIERLVGRDVAVCDWRGPSRARARHGWRSSAAVVAGAVAKSVGTAGSSLLGHEISLPPARRVAAGRHELLGGRRLSSPEESWQGLFTTLAISDGSERAVIVDEATLRRPLGGWTLPALLLVKRVHRILVETATRFVFEAVDEGRATALAVALQHALDGYIRAGVLVGPSRGGSPVIAGWPDRTPASPALWAELSAWLVPWSLSLQLRVSVRPGSPATLEVV